MSHITAALFILANLTLPLCADAHAGVPQRLSYQGYLSDSLGVALNVTTDLTFTIYEDTLKTSALWTETHTAVTIQNGLFTVLLGSVNPLPSSVFDGSIRGLAMQPDGAAEMDPPVPIVSVAYAYRALRADTAAFALTGVPGGDGGWTDQGSVVCLVSTGDSVGIGTSLPLARLHVDGDLLVQEAATLGPGNTNSGHLSFVAGEHNVATGDHASVGGGAFNLAEGNYAVVSGGGPSDEGNPTTSSNRVYDDFGTIAGGAGHVVGSDNAVTDDHMHGTVGGGRNNTVEGALGVIGGGANHTVSGYAAAVLGGESNTAGGNYAGALAGLGNVAPGSYAVVAGGRYNSAGQRSAAVGGGETNTASHPFSAVTGGYGNLAGANYAVVGGGGGNAVLAPYSAVLGGTGDTIEATAGYSYLFGIGSKLTHDSTFMVHMPHIRFGDESTGYEWPTSDGAAGQVLTTDGSGLVAWSDVSVGESYWSLAGSELVTNAYWGLSRGGAGNTNHGDSARTMINLGVASQVGADGQHYYYATVGGGWSTKARQSYATVGGGDRNVADGEHSTVGGGRANEATGTRSTVAGGNGNVASGGTSAIAGGGANQAAGEQAAVVGGWDNRALSFRAIVGGGAWNRAEADYATIAGGVYHHVTGEGAHIGGGFGDTASGSYASIGGGHLNTVSGWSAAVAGGSQNHAAGSRSTIGGGEHNVVEGDYGAILGGRGDTITSTAGYSYLFGIGSKLTQDSTFMVDMPHIRFGDEATGYEFPLSDGSTSQVLATDGGGRLSWVEMQGGGGTDNGWTDDGSVIRLTSSTDKVGVGLTNPSAKVEIEAGSGTSLRARTLARLLTSEVAVDGLHDATGNGGQLGGEQFGVRGVSHVGMINPALSGAGVRGEHTTSGYGVHGKSASSFGVYGETDGDNTAAVHGRYNNAMSWGQLGTLGAGAYGYHGGNGVGVHALAAADTGIGLLARGGANGYAAVFEGSVLIRDPVTLAGALELGDGMDYAEGFDVVDPKAIEPGMVLSIDPKNPGQLKLSDESYDPRVAGIVAGANGLGSGVRLGVGRYDCDVALAGRVYCFVDASRVAIEPGDLLTTSPVAGVAMKATDRERSHGAILGKAMESLEEGKQGKILVLVTLQ